MMAFVRFTFLVVVGVFALFDLGAANTASGRACALLKRGHIKSIRAKIDRVVDGDTAVIVYNNEKLKVRFLSIDTPETNYQGKSQDNGKTKRPWARDAKNRVAKLLRPGDLVKVELDVEACDTYGRVLGLIWKRNILINRLLLEEARAVNYCIFPNIKYCDQFVSIVSSNVKKKRGIHSDRALELPYIWRRKQGNRRFSKYIGSLVTHQVYRPGRFNRVPISDRVFFFKRKDIKPPFRLVN